jgi:glycosyltransferase involved in cell wall biosynthesis
MNAVPRLAVVFPLPLEPVHMLKDVGLIPEGLHRRGWDVEMHCTDAALRHWSFPVHAASLSELADPAHWAGRGLDAAIAVTFMTHGSVLRALRSAGMRVVGKGDTDGLLSPRLETRETLRETLWHRGGPAWRARALANWLARAGPLHRSQVRSVEDAVGNADAFVLETDPARRRVARLLERYGDAALAGRLRTVINPVAPAFTRGEVAVERAPLVVAVGRWDDPQKNPRLMARALRLFLDAHPAYRAEVIGADAERRFRGSHEELAARSHVEQAELARLLARARIVVSSSRFESFALASHEGLASGCSVVGPRLAPFVQAVERGPFGTLQGARGARGLADALATEAGAWESGARDSAAIAAHWRPLLDVDAVAERYEELLDGDRTGRAATSS